MRVGGRSEMVKFLSLCVLALAAVSCTRVEAVKSASAQKRSCPQPPKDDDDFRLTVRKPENCSRSKCDMFVGILTNQRDPSFLDVVLEGKAGGWVAVGFSKTNDMYGTDVLGCIRDYSNKTVAVDTWSPYKSTGRTNILDDDQSGICQYNASYKNGRLACRFSRLIQGVNSDGKDSQDFNLDGQFYALFGTGPTPATSATSLSGLTFHKKPVPSISKYKLNPALASGSLVGSNIELILTKTHGILMVVAWPILAVTAVYFSAFMKPALPNRQWFQIHRALMLVSVFLGASAFIMIFVSNRNDNPRGLMDLSTNLRLSHFIIGATVMTLHLINPLIALFRCKPDGKFRWIFNILHGKTIGYLALLLAGANTSLGVVLLTGSVPSNVVPFGLHVSVVGWCVLIFLTAHFVFNVLPLIIGDQYNNTEKNLLLPKNQSAVNVTPMKTLIPSSLDTILRWAGLVLLLVILLPISIAVCVFIGLHTPSD